MCLGIPGQIVELSDPERKLAIAEVYGVRREINVACIAGDKPLDNLLGEWVLVHVGFAMALIDAEEAQKTIKTLEMLGEAQEELRAMRESAI